MLFREAGGGDLILVAFILADKLPPSTALPDVVAGGRHQYSSASMMVSTRVVFAGSAESSEPYSMAASK